MADSANNGTTSTTPASSLRLKVGLAEMLKGGVIMDVMNVEQARIAEEAGAISVMALERVPAMIRAEGGVARMANPKLIKADHRRRLHPRHGQGPHRPLRRSPGARSTSASTSSTSPRSSPPPMRSTTSTSTPSPPPSSAAPATSARPSAASPKAQP